MRHSVLDRARCCLLGVVALVIGACGAPPTATFTPQAPPTQTVIPPTPTVPPTPTIPPTPTNNPPKIMTVNASPAQICPGEKASLLAIVTDPDGDPLTYSWASSLGVISNQKTTPSESTADYQASTMSGADVVSLTVLDGRGGADNKQINVVIRDDCPIVVKITSPTDTLSCPALQNGACLIDVKGTTSSVLSRSDVNDLRLYILIFPVKPAGSGWYIQLQPGFIQRDGSWTQSPSWLGNPQAPVKVGHTLKMVAVVVAKDAVVDTITGSRALSSMKGQNNDNVVRDPRDITQLLSASDVVNLTITQIAEQP